MKKIAILASGGGSNAEVIINHFESIDNVEISLIITNNEKAYVLERAINHQINYYVHSTEDTQNGNLLRVLQENKINFIVLAGYLKHIENDLLTHFNNKMVNIHPALLPKYGGKGMFGMNVHKAVVAANEKETGITIHYVNEHYDQGAIIVQHKCIVDESDTPEKVQNKVLTLEHKFFASCIEELIKEI